MTKSKNIKNKNLESFVDETTGTNLFFLMNTLHRIGNSLREDRSPEPRICIVTHGRYQNICPNKLSRKALELYHYIMKHGDDNAKNLINFINNDLMDLAAWEITRERVPVFEWNHNIYDIQIIEGLHKVGLSWYEAMERDPHENLDPRIEIPISLPENHDYLFHEFINLGGLVNGAVKYRTQVLNSKMTNETRILESSSLNDVYISIGQYFFNKDLVPIKLYRS